MGLVALFKKWFGGMGATGEGSGTNGNGNGNGKDLRIVCVECRKGFTFEAGEQKFYKTRGLTPPKRCTTCRNKKRRHRR